MTVLRPNRVTTEKREHDWLCAGWAAMRFPKDRRVEAPWPFIGGAVG